MRERSAFVATATIILHYAAHFVDGFTLRLSFSCRPKKSGLVWGVPAWSRLVCPWDIGVSRYQAGSPEDASFQFQTVDAEVTFLPNCRSTISTGNQQNLYVRR